MSLMRALICLVRIRSCEWLSETTGRCNPTVSFIRDAASAVINSLSMSPMRLRAWAYGLRRSTNRTDCLHHDSGDTVGLCRSTGSFGKPAEPALDCTLPHPRGRHGSKPPFEVCGRYSPVASNTSSRSLMFSNPAYKRFSGRRCHSSPGRIRGSGSRSGVQSICRNIDANGSLHLSFPCLVLSCQIRSPCIR